MTLTNLTGTLPASILSGFVGGGFDDGFVANALGAVKKVVVDVLIWLQSLILAMVAFNFTRVGFRLGSPRISELNMSLKNFLACLTLQGE